MSNVVQLNNIDHKNLRVRDAHGESFGEALMCVATFPREFRALQAHYPIVFAKNKEQGKFTPVVLLGLSKGENLFLNEEKWDANYIPACLACKPFFIGESSEISGEQRFVIHIDLDDPKVTEEQGVQLFLEQGGNSDFLNHKSDLLGAIHEGVSEVPAFVGVLEELDLLEPFAVEGKVGEQPQPAKLDGFFTINEEKLALIDNDALIKLHTSGFLSDIYMQLASMSQLSALFERKNKKMKSK